MRCKICGAECEEGMSFCKQCGASLYSGHRATGRDGYHENIEVPTYTPPTSRYVPVGPNDIPEEYKPISMWGYFGYQLLFGIPIVGFILILVFAFGGTQNKNLKNFARSYMCVLIVVIIVVALIFLLGYAELSSLRYYYY